VRVGCGRVGWAVDDLDWPTDRELIRTLQIKGLRDASTAVMQKHVQDFFL
jgi:hypothetical protein